MATPASVSSDGGRQSRDIALLALLGRCAAQDESALASLYDQTSSCVYGVALNLLRNAADAEEVTMDVYTQIWRSAGSYSSDRGSVSSWLVMLARSRAIDKVRSRGSRLKHEEPLEPGWSGEWASTVADGAAVNPEQSAVARQQRERIQRALSKLNDEQRKALELAFFGGYTHSELAERLGEPLGTVKTRIRMGMKKLREELGYAEA